MSPASASQFADWAQRNHDFFDSLDDGRADWPDWSVTVLFYEAVHVVRSMFAAKGELPIKDHQDCKGRLRVIDATTAAKYELLRSRSEESRYNHYEPTSAQVVEAERLVQAIRDFCGVTRT